MLNKARSEFNKEDLVPTPKIIRHEERLETEAEVQKRKEAAEKAAAEAKAAEAKAEAARAEAERIKAEAKRVARGKLWRARKEAVKKGSIEWLRQELMRLKVGRDDLSELLELLP